jgi:hypothetical protein
MIEEVETDAHDVEMGKGGRYSDGGERVHQQGKNMIDESLLFHF